MYFSTKSAKCLEARVVLPARIGGVLAVIGGDQALGLLETRRLQHRGDRDRDVGDIARRRPAEIVGLADRLRREFRRRGDHEHIGARALQRDDLRIDGRLARSRRRLP